MADMTQPDYVKNMGIAKQYQKYAGVFSGAGAMAELFGGLADFSVLNFQAQQKQLQGQQAGLVAGQQANLLREKIMGDIQNSFATYAARGVTPEGTPTRMAETSLKEAGEDIQTLKETAKIQEEFADFEAQQLQSQARLQLFGGIMKAITGGVRTYGMMSGSF